MSLGVVKRSELGEDCVKMAKIEGLGLESVDIKEGAINTLICFGEAYKKASFFIFGRLLLRL